LRFLVSRVIALASYVGATNLADSPLTASKTCGWNCANSDTTAEWCIEGEATADNCTHVVCNPLASSACPGGTCVDTCRHLNVTADSRSSGGTGKGTMPNVLIYIAVISFSVIIVAGVVLVWYGCFGCHRCRSLPQTCCGCCKRATRTRTAKSNARGGTPAGGATVNGFKEQALPSPKATDGDDVLGSLPKLQLQNPQVIERTQSSIVDRGVANSVASLWDEWDLERQHATAIGGEFRADGCEAAVSHTWLHAQQVSTSKRVSTEMEVNTTVVQSRLPPGRRRAIVAAKVLTEAVQGERIESIQAAIVAAREACVENETIQAAEHVLSRLVAAQVLNDAVEAADANALDEALLRARGAGVALEAIAAGRAKLRVVRATTALRESCAAHDEAALRKAIAEAVEAGADEAAVEEGRMVQRRLASARELVAAVATEDEALLRGTLEVAREVGVASDVFHMGERQLKRVVAANALKAATAYSGEEELRQAVANAKEADVSQILVLAADGRLQNFVATRQLEREIREGDVASLPVAIHAARVARTEPDLIGAGEVALRQRRAEIELAIAQLEGKTSRLYVAIAAAREAGVAAITLSPAETSLKRLLAIETIETCMDRKDEWTLRQAVAAAKAVGVDRGSLCEAERRLQALAAANVLERETNGNNPALLEAALKAGRCFDVEPGLLRAGEAALKRAQVASELSAALRGACIHEVHVAIAHAVEHDVDKAFVKAAKSKLQTLASAAVASAIANDDDERSLLRTVAVAREVGVPQSVIASAEKRIQEIHSTHVLDPAVEGGDAASVAAAFQAGAEEAAVSMADSRTRQLLAVEAVLEAMSGDDEGALERAIFSARQAHVAPSTLADAERRLHAFTISRGVQREATGQQPDIEAVHKHELGCESKNADQCARATFASGIPACVPESPEDCSQSEHTEGLGNGARRPMKFDWLARRIGLRVRENSSSFAHAVNALAGGRQVLRVRPPIEDVSCELVLGNPPPPSELALCSGSAARGLEPSGDLSSCTAQAVAPQLFEATDATLPTSGACIFQAIPQCETTGIATSPSAWASRPMDGDLIALPNSSICDTAALAEAEHGFKFEESAWQIVDEERPPAPIARSSLQGLGDSRWVSHWAEEKEQRPPFATRSHYGVPGSSKFEHPGWNIARESGESLPCPPLVPRTQWYQSHAGLQQSPPEGEQPNSVYKSD
jgi:hypothetical protein